MKSGIATGCYKFDRTVGKRLPVRFGSLCALAADEQATGGSILGQPLSVGIRPESAHVDSGAPDE